jgi:hypothetical protein
MSRARSVVAADAPLAPEPWLFATIAATATTALLLGVHHRDDMLLGR